MNKLNLAGKQFGRLKVIQEFGRDKQGRCDWLCKCECGNEVVVHSRHLVNGKTISCGCLQKELVSKRFSKHGLTKEYKNLINIWSSMNRRCSNSADNAYKNYGGRGIKVCNEWKNSVESFCDWAIHNGYQRGLSIDRIDVNGNYEPSNCQWITRSENSKKALQDRKDLQILG